MVPAGVVAGGGGQRRYSGGMGCSLAIVRVGAIGPQQVSVPRIVAVSCGLEAPRARVAHPCVLADGLGNRHRGVTPAVRTHQLRRLSA